MRPEELEPVGCGGMIEQRRLAPGDDGVALEAIGRVAVRHVIDQLRRLIVRDMAGRAVRIERRELSPAIIEMAAFAAQLEVRPGEGKAGSEVRLCGRELHEGLGGMASRAVSPQRSTVDIDVTRAALRSPGSGLIEAEPEVAGGAFRASVPSRERKRRGAVVVEIHGIPDRGPAFVGMARFTRQAPELSMGRLRGLGRRRKGTRDQQYEGTREDPIAM